jgi:hypothetical protein
MKGYGNEAAFYEGVEVNETFERDFRPLSEDTRLTPVALVLVLDLYFRLTPITMVAQTPEVAQLARKLQLKAQDVVEVLDVFQICDPYLKRDAMMVSEFLLPCRQIWQRFGNDKPEKLAALAAQLKAYFV